MYIWICSNLTFQIIYNLGPQGDPCLKVSCPLYAHCKASFDGNSASCHCPDTCVSTKLSQDSLVCGRYLNANRKDVFFKYIVRIYL